MKPLYFIVLITTLVFTSCSTPLTVVKDPSIRPFQYHKPLFIIENFTSSQSNFQKFFDQKATDYQIISRNNQKIQESLKASFPSKINGVSFYTVTKNIDQDLVLNPQNQINTENDAILNAIRSNNADLVITIYTQDIHRTFSNPSTQLGINTGNPNVNIGVSTATSSNLSYNYIVTAVDPITNLEVWKGKYTVKNASNIFSSVSKNFCKQLTAQINKDQLF